MSHRAEPEKYLPAPPNDAERDLYLGHQQRWLGLVSFAGYLLIVISVGFFIAHHIWAAWLLIPLVFSAASTALALITTARKSLVTLESHRALVENWSPAVYPSCDVFLPSAGEPLDVIDNTFTYVEQLQWKGALNIYVLDDSGRPEVAALAREHSFTYLSRPDRGHLKKAGNLRYGFDHSHGELIAIFDADFVPRHDFISELAPYFDEPTTAVVQSPQHFDADPRMGWLQRAAGSTQVLFYRYVQPGRDASGAAICAGTCAMYRRASLDIIGGFAQMTHSEDIHTGVNLLELGYRTRYVATVLCKGVSPSVFSQFVTQQYRWCAGSMTLLFSRRFHTLKLTFMQRLCFWAGFLFYISTALDLVTSALPPLLMGVFSPSQVRIQNYIFVMLAIMVRQIIVPAITNDGDSLVNLVRIQTTYSFSHTVQIWDQLRGREHNWVATGAAGSSDTSRRIIRSARVFLVTYQVLLWLTIAWRGPEYGFSRYWAMIFFGLFDLYITFPIIAGRPRLPKVLEIGRNLVETGRPHPDRVVV